MAVLVGKHPQRRYQTIGGLGLLSQGDMEQADRLDAKLEERLQQLARDLEEQGIMPSQKGKGSLTAYWELGRALKDVADSEDFPNSAELPLLWKNAKMYLDELLLYRDRGPRREHLWYCYRLAAYPKELVKKMKWGEWVTIFDSAGINQEPRFDDWFTQQLALEHGEIERKRIRFFAPCVNAMLGNIDVPSLTKSELHNCYSAGWALASSWDEENVAEPGASPTADKIKTAIHKRILLLDDVMEGSLRPDGFSEAILNSCDE